MDCWECEDDTGERLEVAYADGATESVRLCESCRERLVDGDLVGGVLAVTPETDPDT